ncbi:NAD(P)-dependent alcohol dehydrogenase [Pseudokineococcus basanitobsidens]|uniref:alcohol dehydrogenase n=1 Tax=Pseudokineococcus basanitobsidens TaxID=1926649 RepID=A0ABU8RNJ6_9ACTN
MRAVQYREIGGRPEVVEVEDLSPGPGQVLLDVTAAGLCHSDDHVMGLPEEEYVYGLPLTLGHEGAGRVAALGEGVSGVDVGDSVVVYGPWGCGRCVRCSAGQENYCERAAELGIAPPGLGAPGAMAEQMLVDDARHLVPIGDLDPVAAAPLTDAGLTPYHAVSRSLPKLGAGSTAVVIGVGGLGHVGVQLLKVLTGARVVALDVGDAKLDLARRVGADEALTSSPDAVGAVRELTGGRGADVVLDFVGLQATLDLAPQLVRVGGDLTVVGIGPGAPSMAVGFGRVPYEVSVLVPYWGYRQELLEVVELAQRGQVAVETETFTLDEAPTAYQRLHEGTLTGRGVVVP